MENTLENKAIFFSQYWGQKILKNDGDMAIVGVTYIAWGIANNYLEVKSISNISEEDAIAICKIMGMDVDAKPTISKQEGWYGWVYLKFVHSPYVMTTQIFNTGSTANNYYERFGDLHCSLPNLEVWDYLRSAGYALPYKDLSVEEQINYGWIKLKA